MKFLKVTIKKGEGPPPGKKENKDPSEESPGKKEKG